MKASSLRPGAPNKSATANRRTETRDVLDRESAPKIRSTGAAPTKASAFTRGNSQVRLLGGWAGAIPPGYPTVIAAEPAR
jgi:hypothetical protein